MNDSGETQTNLLPHSKTRSCSHLHKKIGRFLFPWPIVHCPGTPTNLRDHGQRQRQPQQRCVSDLSQYLSRGWSDRSVCALWALPPPPMLRCLACKVSHSSEMSHVQSTDEEFCAFISESGRRHKYVFLFFAFVDPCSASSPHSCSS